jgi:PUA-domain protein
LILRRRHYLKEKEARQFLREIAEKLHLDLSEFIKRRFEVVDLKSEHRIFLMNGSAFFVKFNGEVFPTLLSDHILKKLPILTVDMGAVPHLCNGADVMAPGVVKVDGEFKAGDIVVVIDERFSKRIAVGKALYDASEISKRKRGKVAGNIHHVNDRLWEAFKKIT